VSNRSFTPHGDAVQRAEVATLGERLLGAACRREGVVRGDVQVGMDAWIDARDALEVGVDCLTWRDVPGADAVREGGRRLVAEVVSIHGSFLGLETPALTGSLPKRNLDPAERARGAPHGPPGLVQLAAVGYGRPGEHQRAQ